MTNRAQDHEQRAAIADVLHRYTFAIDDQAWDHLTAIFTASCHADYGQFGTFDSAGEVADWMRDAHAGLRSQHCLSNVSIELQGDRATTRSYVTVTIFTTGDAPSVLRTGGEYRDVVVRVGDLWQIAERTYRSIWQDGSLTS